ncbi:ATP-binding cassette domain-containing protein [Nitrosomonas marina]|uniref:Branched-chain amino acid transport system ATP-binding protein/simple sugar transport system ATP-binding protein n=1 Tax=Nitrosomonas marina TaxID=917 RepID=A0A1H8G3E4_9PROT|nr:ATP-binding cassette domain-containing protein [Nitrosomonas marina]SEN38300.1 branched-chain amino acid transport system ATP-binding protein/simple sugar transport system ATP-binding protein [Nitrosomonas marina]
MKKIAEIDGLSIGYDNHAIVHNICIDLNEGESLLIIGHNGAGKTTLLRTIFGLHPKIEGLIKLLGNEVLTDLISQHIISGIRFLGQDSMSFEDLKIFEHRRVLCNLYGFQDNQDATQNNHYDENILISALSIGQRRLETLRMLEMGSPKLFLLDEPTAGIDTRNSMGIINWIKRAQEKNVSFIVAEHNFEVMLSICDKTLVIRAGEVTYFGPSSILLNKNKLEEYFL